MSDPLVPVLQQSQQLVNIKAWLDRNGPCFLDAAPPEMSDKLRRDMVKHSIARTILEMEKNTRLQTCAPESLFRAVLVCVTVDLPPDSAQGTMYLSQYGKQCTPIIGYRGYERLALRAKDAAGAQNARIQTELVYRDDAWQRHEDGSFYLPDFEWSAERTRSGIVGAFCQVWGFGPGGVQFLRDCLPLRMPDILSRARRSQSYKVALENEHPEEPWLWFATKKGYPAVWQEHFEAMCRKTAARALFTQGRVPFGVPSEEIHRLESIEAGEPLETAVPQEPISELEGSATVTIEEAQAYDSGQANG